MTSVPDESPREGLPTVRETVPPLREWVSTYLVGLCMGTADAVPGVSGGTIALIAGVYERLIGAITAITPGRVVGFLTAVLPVDGGVSTRGAATVLDDVDAWFLVGLLGGILTAVVTVTRIVDVASEAVPVLLFGFFFGLIGASAAVLFRAVTVRTPPEAVAAVAGFVVAFVLSGVASEALGGVGLLGVFVAGMFAVSAMILPGISGSLILVILGQYETLSETLSTFVGRLAGLATGAPTDGLAGPGSVVATFAVGGLVGLFTVSRVVRYALDRSRDVTLAFLVALVVGALRAPVYHLRTEHGVVFTTPVVGRFVAAAVVGGVAVLALDWYAADFDIADV